MERSTDHSGIFMYACRVIYLHTLIVLFTHRVFLFSCSIPFVLVSMSLNYYDMLKKAIETEDSTLYLESYIRCFMDKNMNILWQF